MEQQRTVLTVIITVVVAVLVVVSVMAYQSNRQTDEELKIEQVPEVVAPDFKSGEAISFESTTLPPISEGAYALWEIKEDDSFLLLRQFRVDSKGFITDLVSKPLNSAIIVLEHDFTKARSFLVTIETGTEQPSQPSSTIILNATEPKNNTWKLDFPHKITASGSYMLATPTNGPSTNETSGVWFVGIAGNSREQASLQLPVAPAGWVYASFVTTNGTTLPMGRFSSASGKDSFSNFSGPRSFPPFPGEDFLTNKPAGSELSFPLELADGKARVSVGLEPGTASDDPTGEDRFGITLLQSDIPNGAADHTDYPLAAVKELPTATIKVLPK